MTLDGIGRVLIPKSNRHITGHPQRDVRVSGDHTHRVALEVEWCNLALALMLAHEGLLSFAGTTKPQCRDKQRWGFGVKNDERPARG